MKRGRVLGFRCRVLGRDNQNPKPKTQNPSAVALPPFRIFFRVLFSSAWVSAKLPRQRAQRALLRCTR